MGTNPIASKLLDLGFFCALGTNEILNGRPSLEYVRRGKPFTYDCNNGVYVIYDESGRPWIIRWSTLAGKLATENHEFENLTRHLHRGAYVPHSNDGGRFAIEILPTL